MSNNNKKPDCPITTLPLLTVQGGADRINPARTIRADNRFLSWRLTCTIAHGKGFKVAFRSIHTTCTAEPFQVLDSPPCPQVYCAICTSPRMWPFSPVFLCLVFLISLFNSNVFESLEIRKPRNSKPVLLSTQPPAPRFPVLSSGCSLCCFSLPHLRDSIDFWVRLTSPNLMSSISITKHRTAFFFTTV